MSKRAAGGSPNHKVDHTMPDFLEDMLAIDETLRQKVGKVLLMK